MRANLKKNYLSILAYQFLTILTPLLTTPYLARVLGPDKIGLEAYLNSFVQLFALVSILAIPMYASKQLAQASVGQHQRIFSDFFSMQLIMTLSTLIGYVSFILLFHAHMYLLALYSVTLLSTGIDTSWYFVGRETISKVMIRNSVVRLITVIFIFICVKTPEDLSWYILINGVSLLLGQLVTGRIAIKDVGGFQFTTTHFFLYLRPILVLFIVPSVTIGSLSIAKILLESFNGELEVGFFNQSYKLYMIVISFISALTSILMPRMSRYFAEEAHEKVREDLHFSLRFILLTGFPLTGGVIVVSRRFIPWFLGEGYQEVAPVLMIVALSFALKGLVDVFGIQYLVIANRNREYAWAILIGACANIGCSYALLIVGYRAQALAIGLVVGTTVTLGIELWFARKGYSFTFLAKNLKRYSGFSLVMMVGMYGAGKWFGGKEHLNVLIIQSITGLSIYLGLLISNKEPGLTFLMRKKIPKK